jgi:hypothetical protein
MLDVNERRVLGAFRMVSATTGTSADSDFVVDAGPLNVLRNRSGVFVVRDGPGMHDLTLRSDIEIGIAVLKPLDLSGKSPATGAADSAPAAAPAPGMQAAIAPTQQEFALTISDKRSSYLPRRFKLKLPRKNVTASDPDSIFNAVKVQLYPAAAAQVAQSWAVVRVSVVKAGDPARTGLPWSLVQIKKKSDNSILSTGMSDARGEALVSVVGLPALSANGGTGTLLSSDVDVDVAAFFDPANSTQDFVPDPDELIAKLGAMKTASQPAKIASGRTNTVTIEIAV